MDKRPLFKAPLPPAPIPCGSTGVILLKGMSMALLSINLHEYPKKVNQAILCLVVAWALHFVFYFLFLFDKAAGMAKIDYLQLGVGVGICVLVGQIKRWARMMCIFFNIGMIGMYAFVTYAFHSTEMNKEAALLTTLAVILFGLSTYLLLDREVARFFKERDPLERTTLEDLESEKLPPKKDKKHKKKH